MVVGGFLGAAVGILFRRMCSEVAFDFLTQEWPRFRAPGYLHFSNKFFHFYYPATFSGAPSPCLLSVSFFLFLILSLSQ